MAAEFVFANVKLSSNLLVQQQLLLLRDGSRFLLLFQLGEAFVGDRHISLPRIPLDLLLKMVEGERRRLQN